MRKIYKIILVLILIFISIIVLSIVFRKIDYSRVSEGKKPIFCIKNPYNVADGGTIEYFGLNYKIIAFNTLDGYKEIKFGGWDMKYEDFKSEIDEFERLTYDYKEQ